MSVITISRGTMSGGQRLAQCLSQNLGCPCVGREILVETAEKLGVSEDTLTHALEKSPSLWQRLTSERRLYVAALQLKLAEHAEGGALVYHGYAGHLLLRGVPAVLKVRLIAPLEQRVAVVMDTHGLTRDAAASYIHELDEDRLRWVRSMYGVDLRDPELFDLVVNLRELTVDGACAVVTEAARQPEYSVGEEARRRLADFVLASRVKLALASHPATRTLSLEVTCEDGSVVVSGEVFHVDMVTRASTRWEQEITSIVTSVEGVRSVRLDVTTISMYG